MIVAEHPGLIVNGNVVSARRRHLTTDVAKAGAGAVLAVVGQRIAEQ